MGLESQVPTTGVGTVATSLTVHTVADFIAIHLFVFSIVLAEAFLKRHLLQNTGTLLLKFCSLDDISHDRRDVQHTST